MSTFQLYTNAALTVPFGGTLTATQNVDGSTGPLDFVLYYGSVASGKTLKAQSNPGVDQITFSMSSGGSGEPTSAVKMALTQGGLDGATGGASLNLGTTISSGVGNAVAIWFRLNDATNTVGTFTNLSASTNLSTEV